MKQASILSFTQGRGSRRTIAIQTQQALERGSYVLDDNKYDIEQNTNEAKKQTKYYAPDSLLSAWSRPQNSRETKLTDISICEISTLQGARHLADLKKLDEKIGVLNFANAIKPGGGWLTGAQAQEESIARASNLFPTLTTKDSREFYKLHNQDQKDPKHGLYSHAMIYSPGILLFRDDDGNWMEPLQVDVLTSAAVNAGEVRGNHSDPAGLEKLFESQMRERMARILFLFESRGAQNLVLGSFGTGVFQNHVDMVARIWVDLLSVPDARFKTSFSRVVFAILGKPTFAEFTQIFNSRTMNQ